MKIKNTSTTSHLKDKLKSPFLSWRKIFSLNSNALNEKNPNRCLAFKTNFRITLMNSVLSAKFQVMLGWLS